MKKGIGWLLILTGGLFCFSSVLCIPVVFTAEDITWGERVLTLPFMIAFAAVFALICRFGFRLKNGKAEKKQSAEKLAEKEEKKTGKAAASPVTGLWMTSQLAALYALQNSEEDRRRYLSRLEGLGFEAADAQTMLNFECRVIRRFDKSFLLDPKYTKKWVFDLKQPFFGQYPATKEEILRERALTVSELCKIIDEAEWHFWNSHERALPDSVWNEICQWRLNGPGAEFAIRYFEMIEKETGIPEKSIASLSSEQGRQLKQQKWS